MKILLFAITSVFVSMSAFAEVKNIQCKGYVSLKDGTMEGNAVVYVHQKKNGTWTVNDIDAGENQSEDEDKLELDTYSSFLSCTGATVDYDSKTKTMTFRYKYDSGFLGGGCQKTKGTFTDCTEN